ncbi:MAG: hypothetical protein WA655_23840 [Candidatus Korobacteraceae bacterium]
MRFRCHLLLLLSALLFSALMLPVVAQESIGQLYASDASVKGSVILAGSGTSVLSGSSIQAGAQAASLKLDRGGSVLVCEGTKLSVTSSQNGRDLMFSLNSGNLELNYPLGAEADTLLTPDLRLLMPGPGTVHVAVRVTPQGDTCVQSLPWNVSAIVVSETMGDATYQVKPDEAVLFRGGRLGESSKSKQNCGCPTSEPVQVAKATPPPPPPIQSKPAEPTASVPVLSASTPAQAKSAEPMATAPLSSTPPPPEQHLAVAAPFVFRANDPVPDLTENVAILRLENNKVVQLEPTVLPPANAKKKAPQNTTQTAQKTQSHGFFSKVGSFFAAIFH